ncbi:MAG: auxin-responsive promoter [Planctomycetaceae bacterium]|nr:auxin-responsive promoter [Planctomycetaceae bacterium]
MAQREDACHVKRRLTSRKTARSHVFPRVRATIRRWSGQAGIIKLFESGRTPGIKQILKEQTISQNNHLSRLLNLLGRTCLLPLYRRKLVRFQQSLKQARLEQEKIRTRILHFGAETAIGRDFGLGQIQNRQDFRRQLPIAEFDHFAPYIERVAAGETTALFPAHERVLTFVQTSATTGRPKILPVNKTWFRHYSNDWDVWGVKAYCDHGELMGMPIFQMSGVWNLGTTPGGFNIATISAMIERYQSPVIKVTYAIPSEIKRIPDVHARGYCMLRSTATQSLGLISTITPSSILQIGEWTARFGPQLVRDLAQGTLDPRLELPMDVRLRLAARVRRPQPELARKLERAICENGVLRPKDIWKPGMISCWLGGTVGYSSKRIPEQFGDVPLRDQGLLSSEGRHTIPLGDGIPYGPLAINSNYYEFIPAEETVTPTATVLEAHELEQDKLYRIIMTTYGGLYRYDIGDIVKCVGFMGEAPLIEFIQKDGSYCDLEGEKLSAFTVCQAVERAQEKSGLAISCFTVAPSLSPGERPRYGIVVETHEAGNQSQASDFLRAFDDDLRKHVYMYGVNRRNQLLDAACLVRIPTGAWRQYVAEKTSSNSSGDSQYKHKPLVADTEFINRLKIVDVWELSQCGTMLHVVPHRQARIAS